MKYKSKSTFVGNLLIVLSLVGFFVIALPFFLSHLPQKIDPIPANGYFIEVPKISATSVIVVGVDPWNRSEYDLALARGVAQAKGTSLPGQHGLIFLFAHSSGMPWEILSKNIPFLRLGELSVGDSINIYKDGKEYLYTVSEKKVVSASDTNYLRKKDEDLLILQTCWPIGTDWKRLLVFATPA